MAETPAGVGNRIMRNAQKFEAWCFGCGNPMKPERLLSLVMVSQYRDLSPYGMVLFRCQGTLECGTEAQIEVDS